MKKYNPENERIKRDYFSYLKESNRNGEQAVDAAAKAIHRFEVSTKFKPFKKFHIQQAIAFKTSLAEQVHFRTKERLSKATIYSTLAALKAFFKWLAWRPGYKSRLTPTDCDYFNLSASDTAIAKASRPTPVPTIEQIRRVIHAMPLGSDIEKRNRAVIAFALVTGARDNAIASLRLKHVDFDEGRVDQDARQVRTKFSKSDPIVFFPVGDDFRAVVVEWGRFLREERHWGPDDPLFPATRITVGGQGHFEAVGLERKAWKNAGPIRSIFREAFTAAGLSYFNPHSFRKTLARLGEEVCGTPEQFKAWSQNLGHEDVLTTFTSYGHVDSRRQAEIIHDLGRRDARSKDDAADLLRRLERLLPSRAA